MASSEIIAKMRSGAEEEEEEEEEKEGADSEDLQVGEAKYTLEGNSWVAVVIEY